LAKLSEDEIGKQLRGLRDWTRSGEYIQKEYRFKSFMAAIQFINRVAELAEKEEHHPEIFNSWRTVRLSLTTHDEGGLTEYDFDLAKKIDRLG
jgi:4a-hydroxytetrahydrobiopterin dehydratase